MISKFTQKILSSINSRASNNFNLDSTSINEQGLMVCNSCNKPIQTLIPGVNLKLFIPCDCMIDSWNNSKILQENKDYNNLKNDMIKIAFHDPTLRSVTFESVKTFQPLNWTLSLMQTILLILNKKVSESSSSETSDLESLSPQFLLLIV